MQELKQIQPSEISEIYNAVIKDLNIVYRPTQLDFIQNLYKTFFTAPIVNFNEASTGFGKSFAYLIPSFIHAKNNPEEKIIISSKTLNLQSQLLHNDIPVIKQTLTKINPDFANVQVTVLKGRSNYFCGYRCFMENKKAFPSSIKETIDNWLAYSTGEKDDFLKIGFTYKEWKKVETKESGECLKKHCPYFESNYCCHYQAKQRAKLANIIIVNHYLLFTDVWQRSLDVKEDVIPINKYTNVILDEAHLLEDIITQTFTKEINKNSVMEIISNLKYNYLLSDSKIEENLSDTFTALSNFVGELEGDELPQSNKLTQIIVGCNNAVLSYLDFLIELLNGKLETATKILINSTVLKFKELVDLFGLVLRRNDVRFVIWKEEGNIKITLIDYKELLEYNFFNDLLCLNLVSATLSYQSHFIYSYKSLYLDKILPSPKTSDKIYPPVFDKSKVKFILPVNLQDYRTDAYEQQLIYIIKKLISENNGSALLLFTSLKRMGTIYKALLKEKYPFNILKQSEDSKFNLLQEFKEDISSVLLGSYSFWEGIDCPGETLTLIVIDKLPFEAPTVVSKALSNQFGGFQYQCFKTTLKVKQGVGRLIRSESDSGKVIICDNRLENTSWGKQIFYNLQQ